jgi:hypothetical protein
MSSRRRPALGGGDVDHPTIKEDQFPRNGWGIMKEKLRRTCVNPD